LIALRIAVAGLDASSPKIGFNFSALEKYDEPLLSNRNPFSEYLIPKYDELVAVKVRQGLKM
jgi:hypothetical protein